MQHEHLIGARADQNPQTLDALLAREVWIDGHAASIWAKSQQPVEDGDPVWQCPECGHPIAGL
jgi:rubrerythrin